MGCDRIHVAVALAFHPDRAQPPPPIKAALNRVAVLMRQHRELLMLRVEGYSSQPSTTARGRHREVVGSLRRAEAVFRYLHLYKGIDAERLDAVGYGYGGDAAPKVSGERWPIVLRIVHRHPDSLQGGSAPETEPAAAAE